MVVIIASNRPVAYNFLSHMSDPANVPLRVFLCHSSKDQSTARELYHQLKAEKWMDVWFIEANLLPSQDWTSEISRAVEHSDVLVVLHSKDALKKEERSYPDISFVLDILHRKSRKSRPIITLRLDDHLVSKSLPMWDVIDFFPKTRRAFAYQNLLQSLMFRAKQAAVSLNDDLPQEEPEKFLVWSPSRWTELILENTSLSDQGNRPTNQKVKRRITDTQVGFWIILGFFGLIIFGFVKDYLNIQFPANYTALPLISRKLPLQTSTPGIGSIKTSLKDGMNMVYVPAGEFVMGGNVYYDERPIHVVNLNAFWIDQTEVTNAMFAAFLTEEGNREESGVTWLDASDEDAQIHLEENSWQTDPGYEDYPVVEVTWYGANAYCSWAGRRLPTEAEWEKAARGTDRNIYPWGNDPPTADLLNFNDNVGSATKVGSYPNGASPYGALDMAGNVWEWVADRHSRTYYANSPTDNPVGPETGFFRVLRGGAWNYRETYARSIHRNRGIPTISHDFIGFRCDTDVSPQ